MVAAAAAAAEVASEDIPPSEEARAARAVEAHRARRKSAPLVRTVDFRRLAGSASPDQPSYGQTTLRRRSLGTHTVSISMTSAPAAALSPI